GTAEREPARILDSARALVEALAQGDSKAAVERLFDDKFQVSLPLRELEKSWRSVVARAGGFHRINSVSLDKPETHGGQTVSVVRVECAGKEHPFALRLSFNDRGRISSLWFVPSTSVSQTPVQVAADSAEVEARVAKIGKGLLPAA